MTLVSLESLVGAVDARKEFMGLLDTPAAIEVLRNKGGRRTAAKRQLLRRIAERAEADGLAPVPAYY